MDDLDRLVRLWRTGELPTSALTADQWVLVQQRMLTLILQEGRSARERIARSGAWPVPVVHQPLVVVKPAKPTLSGHWQRLTELGYRKLVGDEELPKTCARCHLNLTRGAFAKDAKNGDGRNRMCRACLKADRVRWARARKARVGIRLAG